MTAMTITSREWNRISPDFKHDNGRQKTMLYYDRKHGTCSVPVLLDDVNGVEYGPYSFQEHGIKHQVYAYSMAEALEIILGNSHDLSVIQNLKRLHPYPLEEHAKQINGRLVYAYGGRYEISGPDRQIAGICERSSTLKQIYEKHFPVDPRDGAPLSQCTLFYSACGGRHTVPAHRACLKMEKLGPYLEGYALRLIRCEETKEHKVIWNTRPRIIAADGPDVPPLEALTELKGIYGENAYLEAVCARLDAVGATWRTM